jgi:hypothetical protein
MVVNKIDKLRKERKRLLAPPKLEKINVPSEQWHKIREQDFDDAIPVFLQRV